MGQDWEVVEVRPHKKLVIKVDGSWSFTLRNRRFVRELGPRKTILEDQPLESNTEHPPISEVGKKRKKQIPSTKPQVTWTLSRASPSTSSQLPPPKPVQSPTPPLPMPRTEPPASTYTRQTQWV